MRTESDVPEAHELVDLLAFELPKDRFEGRQISVDIGKNGDEHLDEAA